MRFISLVNLIADKEIVQELFADRFSIYNIANELYRILPGQPGRERMLTDYQLVRERLGNEGCTRQCCKDHGGEINR